MIDVINAAASGDSGVAQTIKESLTAEANNVGATLSDAMNRIWSVGDGNAKSVITMYGEDFKLKSTTTNTVLNSIKTSIQNMAASLDVQASQKVSQNKTSSSSEKDPTVNTDSSNTYNNTKTSGDGVPKVGDKVKFVSGQYYYDSEGTKPLGSHNLGKEVYITSINKRANATHPYHISTGKTLGSGDLGWLKLNQISGYATGKNSFLDDELAWTQEGFEEEYIIRPSDGAILTPIARKGSVLNAQASGNIWNMANSPAEFIKDNLSLGTANVPAGTNAQSTYTQHLDKVVFNLPNVKNYDEMLHTMQKDRNFERLIESMTIDKLTGKSSLTKGKSIR